MAKYFKIYLIFNKHAGKCLKLSCYAYFQSFVSAFDVETKALYPIKSPLGSHFSLILMNFAQADFDHTGIWKTNHVRLTFMNLGTASLTLEE
jgi:hypothetical protein